MRTYDPASVAWACISAVARRICNPCVYVYSSSHRSSSNGSSSSSSSSSTVHTQRTARQTLQVMHPLKNKKLEENERRRGGRDTSGDGLLRHVCLRMFPHLEDLKIAH